MPRPEGVKEVHSAALAILPGGERLSVWFGGSAEGARDAVLYQVHFREGTWQEPEVLMTPEAAGLAEGRYIRRVGNTSLYRTEQGTLHLFFVSASVGGWAASSINHMISMDGGTSWSAPRQIITSPFFNLSTLVRHPAISLADGGFLLPIYFELTNKFPELLRFDADGNLLSKVRMDGTHGSLQPCLVALDQHRALAFLRNRCLHEGWLLTQQTNDGGATWSAPAPLTLPNMDSPAAIVRLPNEHFLIAYNPGQERDSLRLAISPDGAAWTDLCTLDEKGLQIEEGPSEYSYPTMVSDGNNIDLIYSYRRIGFRHFRFNVAWINNLQERPEHPTLLTGIALQKAGHD